MGNVVEVKGDLVQMALDGEFDVIMHGCNCFHTMGAGIAKTISSTFPMAYNADLQTTYGSILKLGSYSFARCETKHGKLLIFNLYTQYQPGPNAEYLAIRSALYKAVKAVGMKRIGIPWIGAGIGGLDIDIVREIVYDISRKLKITITLVEYDK